MEAFFQFHLPTRIVFSPGLANDFSQELENFAANRWLLITDKGISGLALHDAIIEGLENADHKVVAVFDDVPSDSGVEVVKKAAQLAKEKDAQGIIALGGGSVMDTAKGANILFTHGGDLVEDYSGAHTIEKPLNPLVAIPTTSGTGSEVTEAIVIYDEETQTKLSFVDRFLMPDLAILDPELTTGLPAKLTAACALDALTHATEALMSVQKASFSDALAKGAIEKVFTYLEKCLDDPQNTDYRSQLIIASTMAGVAFNHSMVGVVHAVAHTIGAMFRVHHGMANGIFLPFGMEYNQPEVEEAIAEIAPFVGLSKGASADEVIAHYHQFVAKIGEKSGVPTRLSQANVEEARLPEVAEKACEDGASFYNPRELTAEGLLPLLKKAF